MPRSLFSIALAIAATAPALARAQPTSTTTAGLITIDPGGWTAERVAARYVETSVGVHQAEATRANAESNADLGVSAFAPRLDLRASYTRLSRIDVPPEFAAFFVQIPDSYGLRASLTVPVTDYFFTVLPSFRAAEHQARVAGFQVEAQREAAALQARESFYLFVRALAAERVAGEGVKALEAYLADLELLVGAGEVTPADVLQARARLAEARGQHATARGGVRSASQALRILLALEPGAPVTVGEDVFALVPQAVPDSAALLAQAKDSRPEMRAIAALADLTDAQIRAAQGGRLPRLAVVGNLDYANPNQRQLPQEEEFTSSWDLSVVLSWSPNDFVGKKYDVDQARLARSRVDLDRETLVDQLESAATQAVSDYAAALESITSATEGVRSAREAYRVRRELLAVGESTPSEVLESEISVRRAENQRIDAYVVAQLAHARVQFLIGKARAQGAE